MKLRPYQNSSINTLRKSFKENKRVLFVLPTGGGKTSIFTEIARMSDKRILIIAHRKELVQQISDRLSVEHGLVVSGEVADYSKRILVGTVQTVVKRLNHINVDLIIVDEAHHAVAGSWQKIIDALPKAYVLGVTATPCRLDGKGLAHAFDTIVEGAKISDLINQGYLCNAKVYASKHELTKIRTVAGDYHKGDLEEHYLKSKITGDIVNTYRKYADHKQTIVFCVSIKHADITHSLFRVMGYKSAVLHSKMKKHERDIVIEQFRNKEITLLISVDIISEGFDVPSCECIILLRPTKSLSLYMQQVGRGLRTYEGKEKAIILDHAGNVFKFGMPHEDREWELTYDKVKAARASAPTTIKQCEECYAVINKDEKVCPECGYEIEKKERELAQVEGELVEIQIQRKQEEYGYKSLEDWKKIARQRGYKEGWAWYRWKARQR